MKFIVSNEFFEKVPHAYFGVVSVKNFDNKKEYDFIKQMLEESYSKAYEKFKDSNIKENSLITPYREAFSSLEINPNKFKCSIEALISRIAKGSPLPNINPIVDLGNALSIKYTLPVGVHDIDKFSSDIEIRKANENDRFIPFGSDQVESPDNGEIIYVSGNDVKTRRWTWRQGENSKVTEDARNFFIPIDGFTLNKDTVALLQDELVDILQNKLGLEVKNGFVDKDNNYFEFI